MKIRELQTTRDDKIIPKNTNILLLRLRHDIINVDLPL